jgi:hypothetical protein
MHIAVKKKRCKKKDELLKQQLVNSFSASSFRKAGYGHVRQFRHKSLKDLIDMDDKFPDDKLYFVTKIVLTYC